MFSFCCPWFVLCASLISCSKGTSSAADCFSFQYAFAKARKLETKKQCIENIWWKNRSEKKLIIGNRWRYEVRSNQLEKITGTLNLNRLICSVSRNMIFILWYGRKYPWKYKIIFKDVISILNRVTRRYNNLLMVIAKPYFPFW